MISQHDLELLNAYIDNALDADGRAALEARLNVEPELRRELETLRAVADMVRALPTLTAPRSFALTPQMARRARTSPIQRALPLLGAAAAIAIVLFGAILVSRSVTPPDPLTSANTAVAVVSTATPQPTQPPPTGEMAVMNTMPPMPTQTDVVSARILPTPTMAIDMMAAAQPTSGIDLMAAAPAPMAAQAVPETAGDGLSDTALPEADVQTETFAVPAMPGAADDAQVRRPAVEAALMEVLTAVLRLLLALLSGR